MKWDGKILCYLKPLQLRFFWEWHGIEWTAEGTEETICVWKWKLRIQMPVGEEMLKKLQSMEQMKGSSCHVVQEILRLPNRKQSVAKGVSWGTEWSFSLISVCAKLEYLNQDTSAHICSWKEQASSLTPISLILPHLLLVTAARALGLGNTTWALSVAPEGKASGIAWLIENV